MTGLPRWLLDLRRRLFGEAVGQDRSAKEPVLSDPRIFTAADLVPGQTYVVVKAFEDYDSIPHPVGESWRFISKNFLPYDDGLSLFVERDGRETPFRLQWREEAQGEIISQFSDYVEARRN